MGDLTKDNSALLDKLVSDCITFGLHLREALEYIRKEYGSISSRTYFRRRANLVSEDSSNLWLSYFTRIGFIQLHRQQIDNNPLWKSASMTGHDLSKLTILSLILTAATLIVGLIILVTKY